MVDVLISRIPILCSRRDRAGQMGAASVAGSSGAGFPVRKSISVLSLVLLSNNNFMGSRNGCLERRIGTRYWSMISDSDGAA